MSSFRNLNSIHIPRLQFDMFLNRVRESDVEVGGLIIGYIEGDKAYCNEIKIGRNILDSPYEFRLDDSFLASVISRLSENEDIIGVIHSHPAPPYPSIVDRKYMKLWPVVWVIVDSRTLDYRGWLGDKEIKVVIH